MKLLPSLAAVAVVVLTSSPAFALFCVDEGPSVSFGMEIGNDGRPRRDAQLQRDFDLTRLRQAGVNATSVERWNGCLRAFVQQPDGTTRMEFYQPRTLGRIQ